MTNLELVDKVFSIPELQDVIFGNGILSLDNIACCAQVSKTWQSVTVPYLWKTFDGSTKQMRRVNQQGVVANGQWIQSLTLTRWNVVEWLTQTGNCTRLERLELQLYCKHFWIYPPPSKKEEEEEERNKKENEAEQKDKKNEKQERVLKALNGLIQQNPRLRDFRCINKYMVKAYLNRPLVNTLINACSPYILHLEFYHVSLKNSDFHALLNHCSKLQVLKIQRCAFGLDFLDAFDGQFPNLQQLSFINNWVSDKATFYLRFAGGKDWFPFLTAAKNSQQFQCLEIASEKLTNNQVTLELLQSHGSTLRNVTELSLNTIPDSDNVMAKILNLVRPLKVLRLINVEIKDETLAAIVERHQTTLLELEICSATSAHQIRGLLSTLRLSRLKTLKVECNLISFDTFVPQLYLSEQEIQQQTVIQSIQDVDRFQINTISQEASIFILEENQHSFCNWTCLMLEDLTITFPFDQIHEFAAVYSSWNPTGEAFAKLYIQALLLLIRQISKLSKLRRVRISVLANDAMDHNSLLWHNLDGFWEQLCVAQRDLEVLDIYWTLPEWLQTKFEQWHEAKF